MSDSFDTSDATPLSLDELKPQLEAILFLTGQPLSVADLAQRTGQTPEHVEDALMALIQDYAFRPNCALEINDSEAGGEGYILQVKADYQNIVNGMLPLDISTPALRTLSAIALKEPILQSDLVELRGSGVYDHMPELLQNKLITKKRRGRSYMLSTTPEFQTYFKLAGDKKSLEHLLHL